MRTKFRSNDYAGDLEGGLNAPAIRQIDSSEVRTAVPGCSGPRFDETESAGEGLGPELVGTTTGYEHRVPNPIPDLRVFPRLIPVCGDGATYRRLEWGDHGFVEEAKPNRLLRSPFSRQDFFWSQWRLLRVLRGKETVTVRPSFLTSYQVFI